MKDYYKTLDIDRSADKTQIKAAYRINAIKYHPDKNFGESFYEEKFKEINEAYSVLNDPIQKRDYDIAWEDFFGQPKEEEIRSYTSERIPKDKTSQKDSAFHYTPESPFFNPKVRMRQETPQNPPQYDHWGNKIADNIEFFILPKSIGKIISGYSDLRKSDKSKTGKEGLLNILKGVGVGLGIGGILALIFSVKSMLGLLMIFGIPAIGCGLLMFVTNTLKAYQNIIGINGFAEYKIKGTRDNLTKKIEVNFNNVTDLMSVTQVNMLNFSYSSTSYGFVWLNGGKIVLEVNNDHDSKKGNPDKERYPEYWLHKNAEKYWTIFLLDKMEARLQRDGFLTFNLVHFDDKVERYVLDPYIKLGIGYIEFITKKGNIRYQFDKIKRIYTKGSTLYIEDDNFEKILFFKKAGNKNEIPLRNLTNRQFFFKAMEILLGYKL